MHHNLEFTYPPNKLIKTKGRKMLIVTAAIIEKDNKILIARRKKGLKLEGKWEFPGGKIDPPETPEEGLKRELKEELNIDAEIGGFFCSSKYQYPNRWIELLAYRVTSFSGNFELTDHDEIKWVSLQELSGYDFAPADIPIVNKLRSDLSHNTCR